MRGNTAPIGGLTVAEYLELEESSGIRHEYVRGEVYAMTGTTARHNRILLNIANQLRAAERGGSCRTYLLDLKVRAADDVFYYPDVLVTCEAHDGSALIFAKPCVVVEISSRSTARIDRGEKLTAYLALPSMRAYVMVSQDRKYVTCYLRDDGGEWCRADVVNLGTLAIQCPQTQLTIDQIYEDVDMPPPRVREADWDEGGWVAPDELGVR